MWHLLLGHLSCLLEGLWHLLFKITMLVKVTARFWNYSDARALLKFLFLRVQFLCSLFNPTIWSVHYGCCVARKGSSHHHLWELVLEDPSETFKSNTALCKTWSWKRGLRLERLPVQSACTSHVRLYAPTVVLLFRLYSAALMACVNRTVLNNLINAGGYFCTTWQGRNPALSLYVYKPVPHPTLNFLSAYAYKAGIQEERSSGGVHFSHK